MSRAALRVSRYTSPNLVCTTLISFLCPKFISSMRFWRASLLFAMASSLSSFLLSYFLRSAISNLKFSLVARLSSLTSSWCLPMVPRMSSSLLISFCNRSALAADYSCSFVNIFMVAPCYLISRHSSITYWMWISSFRMTGASDYWVIFRMFVTDWKLERVS
jgi:hypothetical protein